MSKKGKKTPLDPEAVQLAQRMGRSPGWAKMIRNLVNQEVAGRGAWHRKTGETQAFVHRAWIECLEGLVHDPYNHRQAQVEEFVRERCARILDRECSSDPTRGLTDEG